MVPYRMSGDALLCYLCVRTASVRRDSIVIDPHQHQRVIWAGRRGVGGRVEVHGFPESLLTGGIQTLRTTPRVRWEVR